MTVVASTQHIMLVEDSDDDFDTVREAARRSGLPVSLRRVSNGDECMALLRRSDAERPALVMMDLNTSSTDGREALRQIKADPQFKTIPVAVVTTSANQRDVDLCYQYGANAYHVKPVRYPDHLQLLTRVLEYWLVGVHQPSASKPSP
jgi:CheY-like chemotaxis protein